MACLALSATLLTLLVLGRLHRAVPALVLASSLAAIALLPAWPIDHLSIGLFRTRKATPLTFVGPDEFFERRSRPEVIFHDDDPISTVTVGRPQGKPENLGLYVNGKPDGALVGDYPTMSLTALIPALLAEQHNRAFVIGLGTGVTAGELAALDATQQVVVAEISRGVIAANPLFDAGNLGTSKHPRIELIRGDAYRTLLRSSGRYDVIVSEPSNPWVAGVEMLYSREWFHLYETDDEIVELVLRTYASVFPHVSVWFSLRSDLLLLGFDRPERALDVRALEARFQQPDFASAFARVGIERFPQLLAHELIPLGTLHAEPLAGPIQTLRRPILSDWAARAFFRGREASIAPYLSPRHQEVSVRNSLLRRHAGGGDALPEEILESAVRESCRFERRADCGTFFARWAFDHPGSQRRRAALAELRRTPDGNLPNLAPARLQELLALYSGRIRAGETGAIPHADVQRLTHGFLSHYHHAVPFDRRAIAEAWDRCNGEGCAAGRRRAQADFWGFDGG
jgi:hypothetical protein